ncbi:MAG TPA: MarR family transcriptional regulator [Burkholderiales bacterium]|nr:MarR family transcriptional regulator [Burkholderiales bacterium]
MGKSLESSKGSAWALFLTAHAVLVEQIELRLAAAQLPSLAWYDVLWALERAGDRRLRMSELADMTVITRSNLTRLVDRLEEAGLVERVRSKEDRRGAFAVVTAEGRALRKKMWPVYAAAIKELFEDHITEREAAQLREPLERMLAAIRPADDEA